MRRVGGNAVAALTVAVIVLAVALSVGLGTPARADSVTGAMVRYARGDYAAAAARLTRLARSENARAQAMLGFLYEYGRGVPQNYTVAARWYRCAAEQGEATAQYLLGLLYDKGRGVPKDVVLSQKWLILAAARASRREQDVYIRIRDAVATKMSAAQLALAQQMAIEWIPAPKPPARPRP